MKLKRIFYLSTALLIPVSIVSTLFLTQNKETKKTYTNKTTTNNNKIVTTPDGLMFNETTGLITGFDTTKTSSPSELIIPLKINNLYVKGIAENAFVNNTELKKTLTKVDMSAANWIVDIFANSFKDFTNLTSVLFPNYLRVIHPGAFENCKLTNLNLENGSIKEIGNNAFRGNNISSVKINGNTLKRIGDSAFENNTNLVSINLHDAKILEEIGANAFSNTKLNSVFVSSSCKKIGNNAFKISTTNLNTFDPNKFNIPNIFNTPEEWTRLGLVNAQASLYPTTKTKTSFVFELEKFKNLASLCDSLIQFKTVFESLPNAEKNSYFKFTDFNTNTIINNEDILRSLTLTIDKQNIKISIVINNKYTTSDKLEFQFTSDTLPFITTTITAKNLVFDFKNSSKNFVHIYNELVGIVDKFNSDVPEDKYSPEILNFIEYTGLKINNPSQKTKLKLDFNLKPENSKQTTFKLTATNILKNGVVTSELSTPITFNVNNLRVIEQPEPMLTFQYNLIHNFIEIPAVAEAYGDIDLKNVVLTNYFYSSLLPMQVKILNKKISKNKKDIQFDYELSNYYDPTTGNLIKTPKLIKGVTLTGLYVKVISKGTIIAIVVGSLGALMLIVFITIYILRTTKKDDEEEKPIAQIEK